MQFNPISYSFRLCLLDFLCFSYHVIQSTKTEKPTWSTIMRKLFFFESLEHLKSQTEGKGEDKRAP